MDGRATLKTFFLTGEKPTQGQFADLIDSCFNWVDDQLTIVDIMGLSTALSGKLDVTNCREVILENDPRVSNVDNTVTLEWDADLASRFGSTEATIKVLFNNGGGTFKEQKGIAPIYNYTDGLVSSIELELGVSIEFKIIITI